MSIRIKVIFDLVTVKRDTDPIGSGDFYFDATVDGQSVGTRQVFDAIEGRSIDLPEAQWSHIVDVTDKNEVVISFAGKDEDIGSDEDLGSVRYTLRYPWRQRFFRHDTEYYNLSWRVEIETDGNFGYHNAFEVYACREHNGSVNCTSVYGVTIPTRLEIHPVRPVPVTALPRRPVFSPVGRNNTNNSGTTITANSPINVIPNPAVIPILTAAEADTQTAAIIEWTYFHPDGLNFTDNDPRLEWSFRPLNGGAVRFLGEPKGLKVFVYGTSPGEVLLEVRLRGTVIASYRALVLPIKHLECRVNILIARRDPTLAMSPISTAEEAAEHISIANRFMRQLGLELRLDTDLTKISRAVASHIPGIFTIEVASGTTHGTNGWRATRLNFRDRVINIAYIHSDEAANMGMGYDYPASTIATITDSGTPSASWTSPSGIPPDAAADSVTMTLLPGWSRSRSLSTRLFSCFITDTNHITDPPALSYGQTIAHEVGHLLNLAHRIADTDEDGNLLGDGLTHPAMENIMHPSNLGNIAQDFDILQAKAARQSPIVPAEPPDPEWS